MAPNKLNFMAHYQWLAARVWLCGLHTEIHSIFTTEHLEDKMRAKF